jgi:hypothetical protein
LGICAKVGSAAVSARPITANVVACFILERAAIVLRETLSRHEAR